MRDTTMTRLDDALTTASAPMRKERVMSAADPDPPARTIGHLLAVKHPLVADAVDLFPALPRLPAGAAALLVLRLFIGLGWLRAFAEKATEPAWRDGGAVAAFLGERLTRGAVALPPYEALVAGVFLPHAPALGWLIMAGQLLAGLALLTGTLTRAALLGGLFMNVNFLLAGEPNPSAFYIVIQAALLATGAGAILSVDAWRARRAPRPASPTARVPRGRSWLTGAAGLGLAVAGYALLHARDLSPAGSVHDPAVLLAMLGGLTALWAALADGSSAGQPRGDQEPGDHLLRLAR